MPQNRFQPNILALSSALAAALALSACLSDSPNQVGGEYLDRNGLKLETPLHRVDLKDFPVDSFWTGDVEPARLGDTIVLLGADSNGFSSQARLAYAIVDTTLLDSLEPKTTPGQIDTIADQSRLRLSVGFPLSSIATRQLRETVKGVPSMRFLVESWVYADTGLSKDERARQLGDLNRRFMFRQDSSILMPGKPLLDTMVLKLDSTAYGKDSLQTAALSHLRDSLLSRNNSPLTRKRPLWTVYMQVTTLQDSGAPQALLRLGGNYAVIGSTFSPSLLFGNPKTNAGTASSKTQKLQVLTMSNPGAYAVNSKLRFNGPATSILLGKTRGLHIRIDRNRLLDSVGAILEKDNIPLNRATTGEFDLGYFIPFAKISLPLDTPSSVDGSFPLEMQISSDLDSLVPSANPKADARVLVSLGDTIDVVHVLEGNGSTKVLDTLRAHYSIAPGDTAPPATALHRIIISSRRDTALKDTSYLLPGQKKDITGPVSNSASSRLILATLATDTLAVVDVHINTRSVGENPYYRDPTTGEPLTALKDRIPRFLKPSDDTLTLRATNSFQRIFNRVQMGQEIESDIFIQPTPPQAAVDTAAKARVPYPVMAEIRPALSAGKLAVDITLYLYPLKKKDP